MKEKGNMKEREGNRIGGRNQRGTKKRKKNNLQEEGTRKRNKGKRKEREEKNKLKERGRS